MADAITGKIIVTVESDDHEFEYQALNLTFESSDEEILAALKDPVLEKVDGIDITEDDIYVVRKSENSQMVYVHPKSPAADGKKVEDKTYSIENLNKLMRVARRLHINDAEGFLNFVEYRNELITASAKHVKLAL